MGVTNDDIYVATLERRRPPDPALRMAGWTAHEEGKPFGEGPRPYFSIEALCWRIGWNDRALEHMPS